MASLPVRIIAVASAEKTFHGNWALSCHQKAHTTPHAACRCGDCDTVLTCEDNLTRRRRSQEVDLPDTGCRGGIPKQHSTSYSTQLTSPLLLLLYVDSLNSSGLDFPVSFSQICMFERNNGVSVNVCGLEKD